ncbi:large ribosomal subunit protein mL64 [Calliphora vicina]|uniref:large ribosomal subunit protein mL64 n=1 Tax=Calliphora vicina TaxID=7373 RepID=UPI00325B10C3
MINLIIRRNNKIKLILLNHERKLSRLENQSNGENNESADNGVNHAINCNKSGLLKQHQNMLHNKGPYKEPNSWIHLTEKYQRKVFGRYGSDSGVSPRICFNTNTNNISKARYEELAEPETIQSMIEKYKFQQKCEVDEILKREDEINKKLEKLELWKQELNSRILKKEADAFAAKEKRERLIEEVRRHFGYKVDPRDERFKEVLEQKEREDKKKQKEAKRKAKEQKLMSKLVGKSTT